MIDINKYIQKDKVAYRISRQLVFPDLISSVDIHGVLIDKNINTDIVLDILDKAVKKKYKGYKFLIDYFDYEGKHINYKIKEDYYIGCMIINKTYKTYGLGFYTLQQLKNYVHEGKDIDEIIVDTIEEIDVYL